MCIRDSFDTVPLNRGTSTPDVNKAANGQANTSATPKPVETKTVPHIVSLETPDPMTVVFKVGSPELRHQLLSNLVTIPIIPEGTVAQQKDSPIGSGPFKFVNFDASQSSVELAGNPDYWEGPPKIQKLRVKNIPDANSLQAELQTGGVDIAPNPSNLLPDSVKSLGANPNLKVEQSDGSNLQYLVFNTQLPPLDNVKVRQAIGYAVDRQKIISDLLLNQARIAHSILPPESWAYVPGTEYTYDPERARRLLKEAGYTNQEIVFKYSSQSAYVNNYSQVIQNALTSVGLNVRIETMERNTIVDQLAKGQVPVSYTHLTLPTNREV